MARKELAILTPEGLREELAREEGRYQRRKTLLNIASALIVVAAVTALLATRVLNLLKVDGSSMAPTFTEGELVVLLQTKEVETGDILGFHYGGQVLLKRVIACGGDLVEIDSQGTVFVNGREIEEDYLTEKSMGKCQIEFPYQVPDGMLFVLGDNRAVSMDSRIRAIGCVERSQIIGRVICRVWPWERIEKTD